MFGMAESKLLFAWKYRRILAQWRRNKIERRPLRGGRPERRSGGRVARGASEGCVPACIRTRFKTLNSRFISSRRLARASLIHSDNFRDSRQPPASSGMRLAVSGDGGCGPYSQTGNHHPSCRRHFAEWVPSTFPSHPGETYGLPAKRILSRPPAHGTEGEDSEDVLGGEDEDGWTEDANASHRERGKTARGRVSLSKDTDNRSTLLSSP